MPSGWKMRLARNWGHVVFCALATTSPAVRYMTFWYWNAAPNFAVGFAAHAVRIRSSARSLPVPQARSVRCKPDRWQSRSPTVILESASDSWSLKYGRCFLGGSARVSLPSSADIITVIAVNAFDDDP